jgi:hypothetical protein
MIFPSFPIRKFAAGRLIFVFVDSIFAGDFAAPVTEQREGNSNLIGEGFIREPAIHAHTQDLGVGRFQLCQILLEVFHLLCSTTSERKHVKREHNILLAAIVTQVYVF